MQDEHSRRFLVVVPVALIAEDLAQALREAAPGARVLQAATAAEALALLHHAQRLDAAFIELPGAAVSGSGLLARVRALNGHVVLLRDDKLPDAAPWHLLDMPFSDEAVADLLRRIA